MTDFKVGDEVEALENAVEVPVGAKGIVKNPSNNAGFVVVDGMEWRLFLPSELKLVKPEPKFKVGDWVKVHGRGDKWDGSVCVITGLSFMGGLEYGQLYEVEVKQGRHECAAGFFEKYLEATDALPKFKAGDIVKSIGFQFLRFEGKTLIVNGPSEDKGYDYQVRALGEDYVPGYDFRESELVPGEELAEWEIELLDSGRPSFKKAFVGQLEANAESEPEAVDGPVHYGGKDNPYEVIKVAEAWGFNENAYLFNALKYLGRAGKKGSKVEDLKKLVFYVEREIALEEAK